MKSADVSFLAAFTGRPPGISIAEEIGRCKYDNVGLTIWLTSASLPRISSLEARDFMKLGQRKLYSKFKVRHCCSKEADRENRELKRKESVSVAPHRCYSLDHKLIVCWPCTLSRLSHQRQTKLNWSGRGESERLHRASLKYVFAFFPRPVKPNVIIIVAGKHHHDRSFVLTRKHALSAGLNQWYISAWLRFLLAQAGTLECLKFTQHSL